MIKKLQSIICFLLCHEYERLDYLILQHEAGSDYPDYYEHQLLCKKCGHKAYNEPINVVH